MSAEDVLAELWTSGRGLASQDAAERLQLFAQTGCVGRKAAARWSGSSCSFTTFSTLLASAVITAGLVIINALMSFVQEGTRSLPSECCCR
jgi:hypothetical protein